MSRSTLVVSSILAIIASLLYVSIYTTSKDRIIHDEHGQIILVNQLEYSVIGTDGKFRMDAFEQHYNPTNNTAPFFQVFDDEFLKVIGPNPSLNIIASVESFAFAHEAPVWVPDTNEIFFCSNAGGALGHSDIDHNNQIAKISLNEVALAMAGGPVDMNATHYKIDLPESVQMTNGGTGLFKGQILFTNEGRGARPSNLVLMHPYPPYNVTVALDHFYGRQFNSLNDVKVHSSGNIFFTDVPYGYYQHFKPEPQLPNQIYSFNPRTGAIRVVESALDKPNGFAFSKDYKTVYVADTGALVGRFGRDLTRPATILEYDVDPKTMAFKNRRVFAYADSGAADGIGVDSLGNVYGACFDGVHVWNSAGTLIGKFFLGTKSANFAFAGKGRLVILAETKIYLAQIAAEGMSLMHE